MRAADTFQQHRTTALERHELTVRWRLVADHGVFGRRVSRNGQDWAPRAVHGWGAPTL
jgi:hypothetical protein